MRIYLMVFFLATLFPEYSFPSGVANRSTGSTGTRVKIDMSRSSQAPKTKEATAVKSGTQTLQRQTPKTDFGSVLGRGVSKQILSKEKLSSWKRIHVKSINLTRQFIASGRSKQLITNIATELNKIDGLLMKINKLQIKPKKNKSTLKKILVQLQNHEKKLKGFEEKLNSIGDDAQLSSIDMKNTSKKMKKQRQALILMMKNRHQIISTIIRNMRG